VTPGPPGPGRLLPVPRDPRAYRGPRAYTVALGRARGGAPATPAAKVRAPLRAGQAALLSDPSMFTGAGSARLSGRGRAAVAALATALRRGGVVRCEGYTDYDGKPAARRTLSRRRAAAVCARLVAAGAKVTYTVAGYGGDHPVVVGGTPATRAENRRVVVLVVR
jgi:outer membrane protein OmpA-like peptidoglycan-associated protein